MPELKRNNNIKEYEEKIKSIIEQMVIEISQFVEGNCDTIYMRFLNGLILEKKESFLLNAFLEKDNEITTLNEYIVQPTSFIDQMRSKTHEINLDRLNEFLNHKTEEIKKIYLENNLSIPTVIEVNYYPKEKYMLFDYFDKEMEIKNEIDYQNNINAWIQKASSKRVFIKRKTVNESFLRKLNKLDDERKNKFIESKVSIYKDILENLFKDACGKFNVANILVLNENDKEEIYIILQDNLVLYSLEQMINDNSKINNIKEINKEQVKVLNELYLKYNIEIPTQSKLVYNIDKQFLQIKSIYKENLVIEKDTNNLDEWINEIQKSIEKEKRQLEYESRKPNYKLSEGEESTIFMLLRILLKMFR